MVAEEFTLRVATTLLSHTLPERNGQLRIIACHCSKDQAKTVSLCLIVARILQVGKVKANLCCIVDERYRIAITLCLSHLCKHTATNLSCILLTHLLGELLG